MASVGKGDEAAHLRPTTDRVRESLFNVLQSGRFGTPVAGARVLDLFAGTGALGLEALSRGADHVTLVDDGRKAQSLIRENIDKCRAREATTLIKRDATKLGDCSDAPYDLIFLDPPYGKGLGERALSAASSGGWLAPSALIVWEEGTALTPPAGYEMLDQRRYGDTWITLLKAPE